ncbi:MAG: Ribose-5-phosphate isomerase B [Parcubacteria group bacterium GW2011_GWC1_43_11b]|uniref:Ribose-5-phosphate isomerase n=2 Tax=Candidatus Vogeliibacteriota TaxID=1817922 RepID=A0A1G2QFK5_9BACT|nr:MAG: Ribose-5-phosphate isomerase B [Parcubacteria group bacterium GW2011_GWB1_42_9]KKS88239.1 MAG: Ribose-5-phosphate isomerase B [Parcubacteria group bacterium GW2011_GWC1_43_11b]OHA59168.1 MAG: ribose-5-phosphate isomerase [Candidatus Vogelbacteria bacterium RIFOXYB1_FULL_42_16]OHA60301.1 MAG: ribose-5-phosphate isomerase [Candidatus Vogelbacteria bacterium RIFOXYD1_FULL_42_15]
MRIFLGTDHAGFELKNKLKIYLRELGYEVNDEGAFNLDPEDDYPDFVDIVAKQVQSDPANHRGIVLGASGQGEAMMANRHAKVRATVYCMSNLDIIKMSRLHNDANVLSLGARYLTEADAKEAVRVWLSTEFSGEARHIRRLRKLDGEISSELSF